MTTTTMMTSSLSSEQKTTTARWFFVYGMKLLLASFAFLSRCANGEHCSFYPQSLFRFARMRLTRRDVRNASFAHAHSIPRRERVFMH